MDKAEITKLVLNEIDNTTEYLDSYILTLKVIHE